MIKEAMEHIEEKAIGSLRAPILNLQDGSERIFLYDDCVRAYALLERFIRRQRDVSNVESFGVLVLEEARRAGADGENMTVVWGAKGAMLYLDDRDQRIVFRYKRTLSPQWEAMCLLAGSPCGHLDFIRRLRPLAPSLQDSPEIIGAYRRVHMAAATNIMSSPVLEDGKAGYSYAVQVQVSGRAAETRLPAECVFRLPFARGSPRFYDVQAEISVDAVAERGSDKKTLAFGVTLPELSSVMDQAITDELADFRKAVAAVSRLCILEDY